MGRGKAILALPAVVCAGWGVACASAPLQSNTNSTFAPASSDSREASKPAGLEPSASGDELARSTAPGEASPPLPSAPNPPPPAPAARFEALQVPGHLEAVVSLPSAGSRQPVLVATHGAGGAPEPHCMAWRRHLGDRGIVVCPRGAMINRRIGPDAGFYYPNHFALEKEVLATLTSFETTYAEHILAGNYVYAGYSQGATMGALMLPAHADRFKRVLLVEGGFDEWPLASARRFAERGGERVAFVCGVAACNRGAERSTHILHQAELLALSKHAPGAGHTYLGPVAERVHEAFLWLVDGYPGWQDLEQNGI